MSLQKLKNKHKPLNQEKMQKRLGFLHRMAVYYNEKLTESPDGQRAMFQSFIVSILYAKTIIEKYDELTKDLEDIE